MSTQPRSSARAAAKRRAAARRRNRQMLRVMGALFFVGIFIIGTASMVFISQQTVPASQSTTLVPTIPAAGVPAGQTTPQTYDQLVQKGDEAVSKNDSLSAVGYYQAALGLMPAGPASAAVHYKLGKQMLSKQNYKEGVQELQKAVALDPKGSFAADATTLIAQNKDKASATVAPAASTGTPGAAATTVPITGTTAPK